MVSVEEVQLLCRRQISFDLVYAFVPGTLKFHYEHRLIFEMNGFIHNIIKIISVLREETVQGMYVSCRTGRDGHAALTTGRACVGQMGCFETGEKKKTFTCLTACVLFCRASARQPL